MVTGGLRREFRFLPGDAPVDLIQAHRIIRKNGGNVSQEPDTRMQDAEQPTARINRPVFLVSAGLIVLFAAFGAVFPDIASASFTAVQQSIVEGFGWFYIAAVAGFLAFALFLMLRAVMGR